MQLTLLWLGVIILALVVEGMTATLTAVWFAAGGLISLIVSFFTDSLYIQLIVFVVASAAMLLLTEPLVKKKVAPKKVKTNYDMLLGEKATVIEDIVPSSGKGQISFRGQIWSARSEDDSIIESGKIVIINSVKGVHTIVTEIKESEEN